MLNLRHVSKTFPGVQAVADVDLSVRPGETVGVVGENGAGKSTLMKIVSGVYPLVPMRVKSPSRVCRANSAIVRDAEAAGVVLVPQELYVAPGLSVAENMFMSRLPGRFGFLDREKLRAMTQERLRFFGIDVEPDAPAGRAQPLRAAARHDRLGAVQVGETDHPRRADCRPTESEAKRLYAHIRRVCAKGVGCLYISHRLDEIEQIADRVVVMRNGRVAAQFDNARGRNREIVRAMIGRDPGRRLRETTRECAKPILTVENLTLRDPHDPARVRVDGVSFTLHRGEILGLFGLVGAGRTELAQAIFGVVARAVEGSVRIEGSGGRPRSPREAISAGIGMLTENRKQTGLMEGQSVTFNMSAASIDDVMRRLVHQRALESERVTGTGALSGRAPAKSGRCPSNPSAAETSRRCCSLAGWRPTLAS